MRFLICRLVLLLGMGSLALNTYGLDSSITWESFGRDQGLSGSSVTAIAQDDTGFLWFSTHSGLNRWDGYSMRVWQKEPFAQNTLSHNLIQTLTLDHGSVLWLGTYGGLDRFDTVTETFRSFRHRADDSTSLSHDVVTKVFRDSQGQLWVGTLDGLNRLNEATGQFAVYPFEEGVPGRLSGKTVRTLVEDSHGRLWVGTSGGLDLYDAVGDRFQSFTSTFPGQKLPSGAVMASLRLPGDADLWLAIWGVGLVRMNPMTGAFSLFKLPEDRVYSLSRGEAGEIHVGTWGGGLVVFRPLNGETLVFKHDPLRSDSLGHDVVYGTYLDKGGLLWVATNGGGVSRYNPRRQQFHLTPTLGKVPGLIETADSSLWVSVYNEGLLLLGPRGQTRHWKHDPRDPQSLPNDIINGMTVDHQGRLWLLTNLGVAILDPVSGRLSRWSPEPDSGSVLPDEVVNALCIDDKENYWFGTYRAGLVRRPKPGVPGTVVRYVAHDDRVGALPDNLVYFVQQDRERRIWVGTNGGLALYRPNTDDFKVWRYDAADIHSLPSNTVRSLLEDSRGRFWVVTNGGGLSRIDPDSNVVDNFGLNEGLSSLSVYAVVEDQSGTLWVSSANGLFSFQTDSKVFRRYSSGDGLSSPEFWGGGIRRQDGSIAFGGLQGVMTFHPGRLSMVDIEPSVALTSIQVLGKSRPVVERLVLGWQENAVTFSFSALDFRNPDKNLYAFQLEGFDRDWVQAGTRHEATYTNLWPGTYHFRFKGANPAELWAQSPQTVTVVVEAAPWASWYAWVVYTAIVLIMIYLYQRARVSRSLGQKVEELERLRGQLEQANLKLDQLARLDGLTGIANRRALDTWLGEEWQRAMRQRQSIAVLMLDIDDFKRYNDFYGHLAGDTCLKAVAQTLASHLHRNTDFCGRFGGEEFVVVLHDTDLEGGRTVAHRLMDAIDQLAIPHQMATAVSYVSLSIGVSSQVPSVDHSINDLLQRADQALYRAKALGRHRVETT